MSTIDTIAMNRVLNSRSLAGSPDVRYTEFLAPPPIITGATGIRDNAIQDRTQVSVPTGNNYPTTGAPGSVGNETIPGVPLAESVANAAANARAVLNGGGFADFCRRNPVVCAVGGAVALYLAFKVLE